MLVDKGEVVRTGVVGDATVKDVGAVGVVKTGGVNVDTKIADVVGVENVGTLKVVGVVTIGAVGVDANGVVGFAGIEKDGVLRVDEIVGTSSTLR